MTIHLKAPSGTGETALCGAHDGRVEDWTDCPQCLVRLARKDNGMHNLTGLVDARVEKLVAQGLGHEQARELAIDLEVAEYRRVRGGSALK